MTNIKINVCRICLQTAKDSIHLFSEHEKSKEVLNTIYLCFQIVMNPEEDLPNIICRSCIKELNTVNNFRIMCTTINERFADYCKQHSNTCNLSQNTDFIAKVNLNEDSQECSDDTFVALSNQDTEEKKPLINNYEINGIPNLNCNICNKVLKSMTSLLKHKISMHEKRNRVGKVTGFGADRRYHCTSCSYSTPHSQTLTNHMRRHNGERPYFCECGKRFTQSSSLAAHRKTHSTTTYSTCSICGKQFKHAFALKNHLGVHENGHFSCSICQKVLKSKRSLGAHMQRHYNICNYNCEDCGDTFVTSAELLNHRKKHSIEKNVECHLCGYKTRSKKNLIVHLKRHAGNKAYKCDMCKVSFYTRGDLRRHRRVHTREKPFSCPTCAQRFTHSPSLNKHMQTVHGIEYKWGDVKWKQTRGLKLVIKKDEFS